VDEWRLPTDALKTASILRSFEGCWRALEGKIDPAWLCSMMLSNPTKLPSQGLHPFKVGVLVRLLCLASTGVHLKGLVTLAQRCRDRSRCGTYQAEQIGVHAQLPASRSLVTVQDSNAADLPDPWTMHGRHACSADATASLLLQKPAPVGDQHAQDGIHQCRSGRVASIRL